MLRANAIYHGPHCNHILYVYATNKVKLDLASSVHHGFFNNFEATPVLLRLRGRMRSTFQASLLEAASTCNNFVWKL